MPPRRPRASARRAATGAPARSPDRQRTRTRMSRKASLPSLFVHLPHAAMDPFPALLLFEARAYLLLALDVRDLSPHLREIREARGVERLVRQSGSHRAPW